MNDTTTTSQARLVLNRTFAAPIARVYDAWTKIDRLRDWFCPAETTVTIDEFDFRVGGRYRMTMHRSGGEEPFVVSGVYHEIVEPELLAYTWRWQEDRPEDEFDTLVRIEFYDRGSSTEIVLVHERLASEESRANHEQGWKSTLDSLVAYLGA